jgi:hypothetical protein
MLPGFVSAPANLAGVGRVASLRCGRPRTEVAGAPVNRRAPQMLGVHAIADHSYQLEEMEDEASATSALFLRRDGSIAYGRTDGPEPATVRGVWVFDEYERELRMELERNFIDGDVAFSVRRVFKGHLDCAEDLDMPVFSGNIFRGEEDFWDPKAALGHWSMIIATDDLPAEDYDATQLLS